MRQQSHPQQEHSGKYNLPYIWDRVLFTTQELKIKDQQEQECQVHNTTLISLHQEVL